MDLAYILTRKLPKSGGFGGLAHMHVNGGVQIVYGNMASNYATQIHEIVDNRVSEIHEIALLELPGG